MVTVSESTTRTGMRSVTESAAVEAAWKVADRPEDSVMQTHAVAPGLGGVEVGLAEGARDGAAVSGSRDR